MTAVNPEASRRAVVEAALVLLERMGLTAAIADPERRAYVTEIAALMDARKDRIGEHTAEHGNGDTLQDVPVTPVAALAARRASHVAGFRWRVRA
jgi:hypothetical protein